MTVTTELIPFHGDQLLVLHQADADLIAIKPICERLGIDHRTQRRKLHARPELWGGVIMALPSASGDQDTLCLPVNRLAAWLFSINPGKVGGPFRDALIRYQIEAADALDAHFRAQHTDQRDHIEAMEEQMRLAASALLSAQPLWNKIARYQELGIPRQNVRHLINRSEKSTDAIIDLMEMAGAIDWMGWSGWNSEDRRTIRKSDFYTRAVLRRNIDKGAYTPEMRASIEAGLAEPVEPRG